MLGYTVVASSSTAVKQDYNEYMWTLRRDVAAVPPTAAAAASEPTSTATADATGAANAVANLALGGD